MLGKAACLPPEDESHRIHPHLGVPLLGGNAYIESEALLGEEPQSIDDVIVAVRHGEAKASRMQGSIAHEVADKFCQFGAHRTRWGGMMLAGPVGLGEGRKRNAVRLANERMERQRDEITFGDVSKALPFPY